MLINVRGAIDPAHYGIILAESLCDKDGNFYDLTLKQNFDEHVGNESYVANYQVDLQKSLSACKLVSFMAWTPTKVIFINAGPFTSDTILDAVPRNPT